MEVGWPWMNDFKMPYFLMLNTEDLLLILSVIHMFAKTYANRHTDVCMCLCAYSSVAVFKVVWRKRHPNKNTEIIYIFCVKNFEYSELLKKNLVVYELCKIIFLVTKQYIF